MNTTRKELNKEKLQHISGGTCEDLFHCIKCQAADIRLIGPADIGTPPTCHCQSCGYEWMMAL